MNAWLFACPYEANSPNDVQCRSREAAGWAGRRRAARGSLLLPSCCLGQAQMMAETKRPLGKRQPRAQEKHLKQQCFPTRTHGQGQDVGWGARTATQHPGCSPLPDPCSCKPTNSTTCRRKARASPKGGLVGTAQLRDAWRYSRSPGSSSTAVSHAPGENRFGHSEPLYPHVLREAGKLTNRAYKQHDLGNYASTRIYYLETMSGIKLPGKFRFQSK